MIKGQRLYFIAHLFIRNTKMASMLPIYPFLFPNFAAFFIKIMYD